MKYTEQDLKDEYEQAVKRNGKLYAEGYIEGLKDAQNKACIVDVIKSVCEHEKTRGHDGLYYCGKCGKPMASYD